MLDLFVKTLATWYCKKCSICGTTRIETVLSNFKGKTSCPECKKHLTFARVMFKTTMMSMRIGSNELSNLSSDKETVAIINALLRGISSQGLRALKIGLPLYVVFDVTNRCNLHCIHCYSSEQQKDLKTTDVYHVLDTLYEAGAGIIDFGGGEPLLRNDIFEILSYSKKLGLYTSISTNGTLLNDHCIQQLKRLDIDHVCVSLDGAKPQTHDRIRNKEGTYEKTIQGIKNCVDAGIQTQVSTVFMKNNINEVTDLYNVLDELKINGWYIYDFVPAGRGKELQEETLDPKQRKHLFEYLQDLAVSSKMELKPYPYLITVNSACPTNSYFFKKYGRLTEFFKGCLSGRWVCMISSNGDVHPCHLLPHTLGNLTQDNFHDVWFNKNNIVLTQLRERRLLKGACGRCDYRDFCGGCRAQAFWRTGDYLESDLCWIKD